ncbi:unnamed protein product [Linum tenue]|uniref:Clp R domain-containing protein n=2 Tax=Linum tenue TaxID=586396 RepID=A0AAV0KZZ5_9ROSI|nr:unnamed protein product [Linum tenue]
MRAGLSTIQQTLTPEAATVLNHSIAEAGRRNHGQTTPLHVAATLLSSPSGYLRQACIKSHPNSSHPLQCRALELCFSVALERLPTGAGANSGPGSHPDPPISNALMAALKRAQAHQRRGCPEQQQQPLLAVKVELEQLIISILDDPSVSRVMREASFSSPAVKATIEQSLNSPPPPQPPTGQFGQGFRVPVPTVTGNRNLYANPRLQGTAAGAGQSGRNEEAGRVVDILLRSRKRNPVLVGETEPELVVKEVLKRVLEGEDIGDEGLLRNLQVIHLEKEFLEKSLINSRIGELAGLVANRITSSGSGGAIVDLGDLKWLVEQQIGSDSGKTAVAEMGKLVAKFRQSGEKIWLIGTATCETYLRCQVYHPSMENDWDLQAVPIANRAPPTGMFPRIGNTGFFGNSLESLSSSSPLKGFPMVSIAPPKRLSDNNLDTVKKPANFCPQCKHSYEQELAKVAPKELVEKPSTEEAKLEATQQQQSLPPWLKNAANTKDASAVCIISVSNLYETKDQEVLQKKWLDTCLRIHPGFHQHHQPRNLQPGGAAAVPMPSLLNRTLVPCIPKIGLVGGNTTLQLNTNLLPKQNSTRQLLSPPTSPVRTELVLGRPKVPAETITKDLLSTAVAAATAPETEPKNLHDFQISKLLNKLDADSFKKLLKGLVEKVWWQQDAASAVATVMTQCKLGNGKRRGNASKGDIWLLFTGPDRIGKKKMAVALSDVLRQSNPVTVRLGSRRDNDEVNFRGKTVMDRIVDAVRRNPFSVVVLEDIDEADMLVRGSIKRAMERGRLADSHGREISLGNVIFILTASWLPENLKFLSNGFTMDEKKLANLVNGGWQLRLSVCGKTAKRRCVRKDLSFDLNEAADINCDLSDVTVDHEDDHYLGSKVLTSPTASELPSELLDSFDDCIVFKPVDFSGIRRDVSNSITDRASSIIGEGNSLEIQVDALEKISGGLCLGFDGLEEWTEKALVPSLRQLRMRFGADQSMVVRLEPDTGFRQPGAWRLAAG